MRGVAIARMNLKQAHLTLQLCLLAVVMPLSVSLTRSSTIFKLSKGHSNSLFRIKAKYDSSRLHSSVAGQFDLSEYVKSELLPQSTASSTGLEANDRSSGSIKPSFISLASAIENYSGSENSQRESLQLHFPSHV